MTFQEYPFTSPQDDAQHAREAAAFRWLAARTSRVDIIRSDDKVVLYIWLDVPADGYGRRIFWRTYAAPTLLDAVEKAMAAEAESEADQETHAQHYGLDGLDEMAAESNDTSAA